MPIPISSHLKFKRQPTPIALPDSWLRLFDKSEEAKFSAAELFGIDTTTKALPIGFSLRRRKGGAEIWLHFSNRFRMNMAGQVGMPPTFKDARAFMKQWSTDHASPFRELRPYA